MKDILSGALSENDWAAISPQNLVCDDREINSEQFYKRMIVLRNFCGKENYEIINPQYKVIEDRGELMHELCWSIVTVDDNPFWVLTIVPHQIEVSGYDVSGNELFFHIIWNSPENQEMISYIIHEINHIDGKTILDWNFIKALLSGSQLPNIKNPNCYNDLIPSVLFSTENWYMIHTVSLNDRKTICWEYLNNWTLAFHFDPFFDDEIYNSRIKTQEWESKILRCKNC